MTEHNDSFNEYALPIRPETSVLSAWLLGVLGGVALIAAALIAYLPALRGEFIMDDYFYVTNNPIIQASDGLYQFWCTTEPVDYYPVSNTTLWIEWRLWGMNPTGYHVTNLILHIVEALLIWVILRKLSIPGAFLAAVIFAVHPVNVDSVAWIAQRKDMLAMLFFLSAILCYMKMELPSSVLPNGIDRIASPPLASPSSLVPSLFPWYWLSLAAFVLAMLSKGSVAVMPVLLLAIIWWLRPLTRRDLVRAAPFFLVAAALTGVHIWFQTKSTVEVLRNGGFADRLLGAGGVVWFYLYKALLPFNLAFIYPMWHIEAGNPLWWSPLLAALAVTAVLWWYRKSWSRPFLLAWGFFCVALAPVMGFTDVGFMTYSLVADHYQHIAIIGVIALLSALWSAWYRQVQGGMHWAAIFVAVLAVGSLTFLTWQQSEIYRDPMTLYQDTLDKNPGCWLAEYNLGLALDDLGRPREAIERYRRALRLKKGDYPDALVNLGITLAQIGRPREAIQHIEQALKFKPDYANGYYNLALVHAMLHQSSEALAMAQKALELARSQRRTELAKQIENWLNSYRAGLPGQDNTPPAAKSTPPTI